MNKIIVITGVSGMDGSILSEKYLEDSKNIVVGIDVWNATGQYPNLKKIINNDRFVFITGDITEKLFIQDIIKKYRPDYFYNFAAISLVPESFKIPQRVFEINAVAVLNMLEMIKTHSPKTKFYQASTSEQLGDYLKTPQNTESPMFPNSPYAIAKLASFHLVRCYRNAFGLFAVNGMLWNHEGSVPKDSSIIIKHENDLIEIIPIEDLFKSEKHRYYGLLDIYIGKKVWNGEEWTEILDGQAYINRDKITNIVNTVGSSYEATLNHIVFDENNEELMTQDLDLGHKLFKVSYPNDNNTLSNIDTSLSKFMGYVVGDGDITSRGIIRLTGTKKKELIEIAELVTKMYGWTYSISESKSGFSENYDCKKVYKLSLNNDTNFGLWLKKNIYTLRSNMKKIPIFILNNSIDVKRAFFDGYYLADGLKAGDKKYKYKGFTTNSQSLCLGLIYLFKSFSNQVVKSKTNYKNNKRYYYTTFRSESTKKGKHLIKELNEIVKIISTKSPDGWYYDIGTKSHTFATGTNLVKIHNSRRGPTFVTRKITLHIASQVKGNKEPLQIGNMDAIRDWGLADDYVDAQIMMMEHDEPDDWAVNTEEAHSVREFIEEAYKYISKEIIWKGEGSNEKGYDEKGNLLVEVNPEFYRPVEVPYLKGDSSKIREKLGWIPKVKFKELISIMMENDLK